MLHPPIESALASGVGVVGQLATNHDAALALSLPQRHPGRDEDQVRVLGARGMPGEDLLGEHVHDERDVTRTRPRCGSR